MKTTVTITLEHEDEFEPGDVEATFAEAIHNSVLWYDMTVKSLIVEANQP